MVDRKYKKMYIYINPNLWPARLRTLTGREAAKDAVTGAVKVLLLGYPASAGQIAENIFNNLERSPVDQPQGANTCKAIVLYEDQEPPRIALIHSKADPPGPDGKSGKLEGDDLPGGGSEGLETLFETVIREVQEEAGIAIKYQEFEPLPGVVIKLPTILGPYEDGAFVCEPKPWINNTLWTFLLEPLDNKLRKVSEVNETCRVMFAALEDILTAPLAMKKVGGVIIEENRAGIYFSTRQRIVAALHAAGKDFFRLVPNLSELICKIRRDEVGDYVHDVLCGVLQAAGYDVTIDGNFAVVSKPWRPPTDEELVELYKPLAGVWDPVWQQWVR